MEIFKVMILKKIIFLTTITGKNLFFGPFLFINKNLFFKHNINFHRYSFFEFGQRN